MSARALVLSLGALAWLVALVVELVLLWQRARKGPKPPTISMVLRDVRYHLTSSVYMLSGLLTHWFVPWRHATVVGGVLFWLIALGLVVWDALLWRHPVETWPAWQRRARFPPMWLILGALSGLVLFPQGV